MNCRHTRRAILTGRQAPARPIETLRQGPAAAIQVVGPCRLRTRAPASMGVVAPEVTQLSGAAPVETAALEALFRALRDTGHRAIGPTGQGWRPPALVGAAAW
jgi:hypothetical protein